MLFSFRFGNALRTGWAKSYSETYFGKFQNGLIRKKNVTRASEFIFAGHNYSGQMIF
jgi:hypothetical protein